MLRILATSAMATLLLATSAVAQVNTSTTVQDGNINASRTNQRGDDNLATTVQTGNANISQTNQRGCINTAGTGQTTYDPNSGINLAETNQSGRGARRC